jgi:hypothetical protein
MDAFELFLIKKGYVRYYLNMKTLRYEEPTRYLLSSVGHVRYSYFPKSENVSGMKCIDIDRKNEVIFGLNESGKPPTLIYPRPEGVYSDDVVNRSLRNINFEDVLRCLYS